MSRAMRKPFYFFVLIISLLTNVRAADDLVRREWKIEGVVREALVHIPAEAQDAKGKPVPIVFGFHGHGGSMRNAANAFHLHTLWPEAIVVYMQGLKTPGRLTDPEGKKPGWQFKVGDHDDRDLKFFDAVLLDLEKEYHVATNRVYSTGHSNGGSFTYLLWEARPEKLAAVAPSAAISVSLVMPSKDDGKTKKKYVAKPVLHIAGQNDPLVSFNWQKQMIDAVRRLNQCGEGKTWGVDKRCTIYKTKNGADVLTYIHSGTHTYPSEAPEIIVKFFKER